MLSAAYRAWLLVLATGFAVVGLMLGTSSGQGAQGVSARQLLRAALKDGTTRGSVHLALTGSTAGKRYTQSDDAALRSGRQNITVAGGITARVRVVNKVAYISGNERALTDYFGLPASVARTVGNRWISFTRSDRDYSTVTDAVTLPSALAQITPTGSLTELAPTKVDGQAVIGIRGAVPSSVGVGGKLTLYVTRSNDPLPVSARFAFSGTGTAGFSRLTLSRWGERLSIVAPANIIRARQL